jgi:hypothetical protein
VTWNGILSKKEGILESLIHEKYVRLFNIINVGVQVSLHVSRLIPRALKLTAM